MIEYLQQVKVWIQEEKFVATLKGRK